MPDIGHHLVDRLLPHTDGVGSAAGVVGVLSLGAAPTARNRISRSSACRAGTAPGVGACGPGTPVRARIGRLRPPNGRRVLPFPPAGGTARAGRRPAVGGERPASHEPVRVSGGSGHYGV